MCAVDVYTSMFRYLRQSQSQGERSHQQQMGLDPHHGPVGAANRVDHLVGVQVLLGLDAETAHGVDHRLCTTGRDGGDTVSSANKAKRWEVVLAGDHASLHLR